MKKSTFLLSLFLCLYFFGCDEEEGMPKRDFPRVSTLEVTNISSSGATLNAEITSLNDQIITSYGFVWATRTFNLNLEKGDKIVFNEQLEASSFSHDVTTTLGDQLTYFVRAYVTTQDFVVYGEVAEFRSMGSQAPSITSISPLEIFYGDTVEITGENFSYVPARNQVKFGVVSGVTIGANDSLLQVKVPTFINDSTPSLSLSILGQTTVFNENLSFIPPRISSVSKTETFPGDTLEVFGSYFGYVKNQNAITMGNIEVEAIETDSTRLKLKVPEELNENFTIKVTTTAGQTAISDEISIIDPTID